MPDLTFGEQVKIVLSRRGMTIKELAEIIEERTGKKMSRQNLTQRLGRDNFQEQDMRMIAAILECPFELSILGDVSFVTKSVPLVISALLAFSCSFYLLNINHIYFAELHLYILLFLFPLAALL